MIVIITYTTPHTLEIYLLDQLAILLLDVAVEEVPKDRVRLRRREGSVRTALEPTVRALLLALDGAALRVGQLRDRVVSAEARDGLRVRVSHLEAQSEARALDAELEDVGSRQVRNIRLPHANAHIVEHLQEVVVNPWGW